MKKQFDLKDFMTANRDSIIERHENLTTEQFYNGISLRDFMIKVYNRVGINCKSDKTASKYLPFAIEAIYNDCVKIGGSDYRTEALKAKYQGTAYMALV